MQCYGPEAAAYTTRRLFGQVVRLEDDVERHDIYGRRLAYVYLDGRNFERELLRKGYARLLVIEPNHARTRARMLDDELNARARAASASGARVKPTHRESESGGSARWRHASPAWAARLRSCARGGAGAPGRATRDEQPEHQGNGCSGERCLLAPGRQL